MVSEVLLFSKNTSGGDEITATMTDGDGGDDDGDDD